MSAEDFSRQELFEDWMSDQGVWPKAVAKDSRGEYLLMQTASAWVAWRAAWAARSKAWPDDPALCADAERYLWIKENADVLTHKEVPCFGPDSSIPAWSKQPCSSELDMAIDWARDH